MVQALNGIGPHDRLRRIVIVGGGSAGWMTAAALSQVTTTPILLIESEEIGTVGVGEATIPQIRTFNRALGIDEREFLRETKGSFKLGIRFVGWNGEGSDYLHAFGTVGQHTGIIPFHHLWLRARQLGVDEPFGSYSLNDIAARAGKMAMPGSGLPHHGVNMPWAYHFDATLYAAYLRRLSEKRGVERVEGKVAEVATGPERNSIERVKLDDGRTIDGDFFIDCTGFRGLLISQLVGSEFDDWSRWLPCNRALAVPCQSTRPLTPFTTATAHKAGWQWRIPLQTRVGNGVVYCDEFMTDDEAHDHLLATIDAAPDADPRQIQFMTGMRRNHWIGNCLAIGLSAGFLEPLESTSLHLIQYSAARLMAMLPRQSVDPSITDAFNREIQAQWSRIRDFLILHYWANGRLGEAFWDARRAMELPDTLKTKIEQFRSAGCFIREDEELFTEVGWSQVFIGQGVMPRTWHPLADETKDADVCTILEEITKKHRQLTEAMPSHDRFVGAFVEN